MSTNAIAKGHAAARELEQTEAAFAAVRQGLLEKAAATPITDALMREKLILSVQVLEAVKQAVQSVIDTGKVAEAIAAQFPSS